MAEFQMAIDLGRLRPPPPPHSATQGLEDVREVLWRELTLQRDCAAGAGVASRHTGALHGGFTRIKIPKIHIKHQSVGLFFLKTGINYGSCWNRQISLASIKECLLSPPPQRILRCCF